ncbi:hypothetical protein LCGC14_0678100 [marine sediment metagenome]|uniref:FRG domain-containing protein n=1 Tax=marine sediment metagenome TaxID=412755 RepID=A0A0F9QP27_9ZZZZ|nr:FRG domain-containing protein [Methylophaga sp.]
MKKWSQFLHQIQQHLDKLAESGCDMPFFRGHNDHSWKLLCGLGRQAAQDFKKQNLESILYYDFMSLGGGLLSKQADSWDILFAMQHHGLPTRLLDWTTTFSAALYFALRPSLLDNPQSLSIKPCIWILDPFKLNQLEYGKQVIINPYINLERTYHEYFIDSSKSLDSKVVAILPPQHTSRQSSQRSVFTLHSNIIKPLDEISTIALKKFEIPIDSINEAMSFLTLAGVNEFTIFPDLDGLARYLKKEHV